MVSQNSSAALQQQMRATRRSLNEHADQVVETARRQVDWRHYVGSHPWASLGTAFALGYFLVPRRTSCQIANSGGAASWAGNSARTDFRHHRRLDDRSCQHAHPRGCGSCFATCSKMAWARRIRGGEPRQQWKCKARQQIARKDG